MKKQILIIFAAILLSMTAFAESITEYPEMCMGKDGEGNDVMFHCMPTPPGLPTSISLFDTFNRFAVKIGDKTTVYNSETLEPIVTFKQKGDRMTNLFEDGYFALDIDGSHTPNFYNFEGKKVWKTGNRFVADFDSIILCTNKLKRDKLVALDCSTGTELWSRKISTKKQPYYCRILQTKSKPNYFYIVADSIYRFEIASGKSIRRSLRSSKPSTNIFEKDKWNIRSNFLVKGDSLFIADADSLYCFNSDFRSIWQTALPPNSVGGSNIYWHDSCQLILLSIGEIFDNSRDGVGRLSSPFVARFDLSDGKTLSTTSINVKKNVDGMVYTDDGTMYLYGGNKIYYTNENDTTLHKIDFEPDLNYVKDYRHPGYRIHQWVSMIKDGKMERVQSNKNGFILEIDKKKFYKVYLDGHSEELPTEDVFFYDINDLYISLRNEKGINACAVVNPDTKRVIFYSKLDGDFVRDKNGSMLIRFKTGIAFRKGK